MAATPEDIADQIRRETGGQEPGREGSQGPRGWPGGSNNFARFPYGTQSVLDMLAAARRRPAEGPGAIGRRLYEIQQAEAKKPRGTSYLDYMTSAEREFLRREIVRSQLDEIDAVNAATEAELRKQRGQIEEAQRAQSIDQLHRDTRRALATQSGGPAVDALAVAGLLLVEEIHEKRKESDRRKRILAVGRRGAAATRVLQPAGRPNRTGAAATRPLDATPPGVKPSPIARGAKSAGRVSGSGASATGKARERVRQPSVVSQQQGQVQVPRQRTAQRGRLSGLFSSMLRPLFPSLVAPRVRVQPPTRSPTTTRSPPPSVASLTALNAGQLGSPPVCKCPSEKPRKPKRDRCTNPVISKTVDGNVQTIKRELTCPQSKPR